MSGQYLRINWGDELNGLRLGIRVEKYHYYLGEKPIILEIFLSNISSDTIKITETHIFRDYEFELLINDSLVVSMTPEGDKALQAARSLPPARRTQVTIQPGTIYKVDWPVRLDDSFPLAKPGIYTVRVWHRNWQGAAGLLSSGPARFTIA